ncbi:MAG: hypothetical protein Q9174_007362, partial [Haloplaca sp. 1 TL-2023]
FKAALALQNIHHTGASQAFFGAPEAARVWPTAKGDPDPSLPNTMDIPGPTWETIINRIHIDRSQPLLSWLLDLQSEQALLTKHAAAPFMRIVEALTRSDPVSVGEQHDLHDSVFRRQNFNWLPPSNTRFENLVVLQSLSRADIGLQWNFRHEDVEQGVVAVNVNWDDCQLRKREVEGAMGEVFEAARWIVEMVGKIGKGGVEGEVKVGECPLLGRIVGN